MMDGKKNSLLGRSILGLFLICCVSFASAQTIWKGESYFKGNRNLVLPPAGLARAGHRNVFYIVNKSPAQSAGVYQLMDGGREPWAEDSSLFHGPVAQKGSPGYTPAVIHAAYGIPANGGSNAIAIVDAYDFSTALPDFNFFSKYYSLPVEPSTIATANTNQVFQVVYAGGAKPTDGQANGWNGEEALDIEWAHAMAPKAKIYLVEAASDLNVDLDAAVQVAAGLPGVKEVSNSYGSTEYPGEVQEDSIFEKTGVVFFASAGDAGGFQEYPSESPNVVGVGGTSLHATTSGYLSESAWNESGGGPSSVEPTPTYQSRISNIVLGARGCPDVSAVADPNTGCWVYSTKAFGAGLTWEVIGGTSLACPVYAAITNQRANFTHSSFRELQRIYFNLGGVYYRDVRLGVAGGFNAQTGWDFITGIGTPNGLFPNYSPPELRPAAFAGIYNNVGFGNLTNQTQILSAVKSQDVLKYNVTSVNTAIGQTAEVNLKFTMDRSFASLSQVQVTVLGMAPIGTTLQVFAQDLNPSDSTYGQYVYVGASPASGKESTLIFNLSESQVSATGAVSLILRPLQPTHMATGNFVYSIDEITLAEVTVPAWDVNLAL
jgi:subtilase family serine protease